MTKKELQAELIRRIKKNEELIVKCDNFKDQRIYNIGQESGLKLALQLIEHLDEGKA